MSGLYSLFGRISLLVVLAASLGACSTSSKVIHPLPKELPPDLQAKFEVMEASLNESPEDPKPTPPSSSEKKKPAPKKTAVAKKNQAAAPAPKTKSAVVYPSRRPSPVPFWIGEKMTLEITYIGMAAGEFTAEVLPTKKIGDRKVYHLKAHAKSSKVMNLFYSLNDTIQSFWDYDGLFSHRFHMLLDQTKVKRDSLELFDSAAKKVFYWDRKNHVTKGQSETKEYFDMTPFSQDSFSALYYLRTLPLAPGKTYAFPVVSEGKSWEAVVTVIRREMMDTPMGKRQCIVVRPQTRFQGVMKQERGPSYIWLTDDDRRFVVRLEAKVKVGSVAARLKEVEPGERPTAEPASSEKGKPNG